jgi:hypothetical protein
MRTKAKTGGSKTSAVTAAKTGKMPSIELAATG